MEKATFYIVRHGETDWNRDKLIQGQSDIPLNAEGELQAIQVAETLRRIKFDAVYSSDLSRARRTAEIITENRGLNVHTTPLLRERNFGGFEGKHIREIIGLNEIYREMSISERMAYKYDISFESEDELRERSLRSLDEISRRFPQMNILVTTHAGIMRILLVHINRIKIDEFPKINNAAYLKLESDGVKLMLNELHGVGVGN